MEKCRRKVHAPMCVPIVMCLCRKVVKCKKVAVSTNICDFSATSVQIKEWELNKGMGIILIVLISSLQENTQNSSFKVLDWNPGRFGFPSFEESKSYKDILFPIN
jgi:hypothetical protein